MNAPLIIGHRGASAVAPENTLAAFREAVAVGADGIEFDVRLTRDGVPVVIHDRDLRRTGGLPHRIADVATVRHWSESSAKSVLLQIAVCGMVGTGAERGGGEDARKNTDNYHRGRGGRYLGHSPTAGALGSCF